jgi:hypothetical protein
VPFLEWFDRRTGGNRRMKERQLAFIQQWDHMRDELPAEPTAEQYAARWRTSAATTYRLLAEFRTLFPGQSDPGALVSLLWDGLSEPHLRRGELGSLLEVKVIREDPQPRDLREILPPIVRGQLQTAVFDAEGRQIMDVGADYEAYEFMADRFAWADVSSVPAGDGSEYASFILEGDADDQWLPAVGSARVHPDWATAEMSSAARWAGGQGLTLQRLGIRVPTPTFRLAPGARPPLRNRG